MIKFIVLFLDYRFRITGTFFYIVNLINKHVVFNFKHPRSLLNWNGYYASHNLSERRTTVKFVIVTCPYDLKIVPHSCHIITTHCYSNVTETVTDTAFTSDSKVPSKFFGNNLREPLFLFVNE